MFEEYFDMATGKIIAIRQCPVVTLANELHAQKMQAVYDKLVEQASR